MTTRNVRYASYLVLCAALAGFAAPALAKVCEPGSTDATKSCACGDEVKAGTAASPATWALADTDPITTSAGCIGDGLTVRSYTTLDGGNRVLRGKPPTASSSTSTSGIRFTGNNSEVRNLRIRRFRYGVTFESTAHDDTLRGVVTRKNRPTSTTAPAKSFYGVQFVAGSHANTVHRCRVIGNGDEGVHFGGGSYANTLRRSVVKGHEDEEIYLVNSTNDGDTVGNVIENNVVGSPVSPATATLRVDGASFNVFTGNTFTSKPVDFVADANANAFGLSATSCTSDAGCPAPGTCVLGTCSCTSDAGCPAPGACVLGTCSGNRIVSTRLQFRTNCQGANSSACNSTNSKGPHGNRVQYAKVTSADAAIYFKDDRAITDPARLFYDNRVQNSSFTTGSSTEIQVVNLQSSINTPLASKNMICSAQCSGSMCTLSDVGQSPNYNNAGNIVAVNAATCF